MTTGNSGANDFFGSLAAQGLTPTGRSRLSSSEPNIQEIPAPTEEQRKWQLGLRQLLENSRKLEQQHARARAGCPNLPGEPIVSWRKNGATSFPGWFMVDVVTDISTLAVGDMLLEDNVRFDALNLCKVVKIADKPSRRVFVIFVEPADISQLRAGADSNGFLISDFDVREPRESKRHFFRVRRETV